MHPYQADKDDGATERVLRALGEAQPARGFEDRVLGRLAQQPQRAVHSTLRFGFAARGVLAGAGGAIVVLVVLLSAHLRPKPSASAGQVEAVAPLASPSALTTSAQNRSLTAMKRKATQPREGHEPTGSALIVHARLEIASISKAATNDSSTDSAHARDLDRKALDDLHAASSPPPPLPLTAQERMVKLMLRRGERHELAQLNPAQSVRLTDAERRSFQSFFDPDPSPELALELKKGNLR